MVGSKEKQTGSGGVLEVDPIRPADGLQFEEEEREGPRALGIQSGAVGLDVSTVGWEDLARARLTNKEFILEWADPL